MPDFFDDHPQYYSSDVGASPDRLKARYKAIIADNLDAIEGKRLIDVACHDGRWSHAALDAGASHIVAIESRAAYFQQARDNLAGLNFKPFNCNIHDSGAWRPFTPPQDTALLLGFLYHTPNPFWILESLRATGARTFIIDTMVSGKNSPVIDLRSEDTSGTGSATSERPTTIVGTPSVSAIDMMMESLGLTFTSSYDWRGQHDGSWSNLVDYYTHQRVTLRYDD